MATARVTITKSGRNDNYGIPLAVGSTYTLDYDFGRSLWMQGYATDTDSVFTLGEQYPGFDYDDEGKKIVGTANPNSTAGVPLPNRQLVLSGAYAGDSSDWLPIVPYGERLAYALDSGSTTTTFSIDVSADGGATTLAQAFTGSYASSSVAEVTYPILFSALTATHFRINVLSGGPISFNRGA